jgi:hypothetical protein
MNKQYKRKIAAEHTDKHDFNEDWGDEFLFIRNSNVKPKWVVWEGL